jgi:hypothetical protein
VLAVRPDDDEHRGFAIPGGMADLDIGFLAVVENANRADVVVSSGKIPVSDTATELWQNCAKTRSVDTAWVSL